MKILILGNCQAPALEHQFTLITTGDSPAFEVIASPPTYTWGTDYVETLMLNLTSCDILLYQPHASIPGRKEWRTSSFWLKETKAKHIVSFPSLYFSGYSPELTYIRCPNGAHLNEGFCDYHDIRLIKLFCAGASEAEAVSCQLNYRLLPDDVRAYAEKTLNELERRENEQGLDIQVSDYLREHFRNRRLFYTFNHPANEILSLVAEKLLAHIGVEIFKLVDPGWELLKYDYFPVMQDVHDALDLRFSEDPSDYYIQTVKHSRAELVEKYFAIYNDNRDLIESFLRDYQNSGADKFHYSADDGELIGSDIIEHFRVNRAEAEQRPDEININDQQFTRYQFSVKTLRRWISRISAGIKRFFISRR